jgi:hypothetical protein
MLMLPPPLIEDRPTEGLHIEALTAFCHDRGQTRAKVGAKYAIIGGGMHATGYSPGARLYL